MAPTLYRPKQIHGYNHDVGHRENDVDDHQALTHEMPRKPKPNRTLPRDGEIVEALIGGRWRKAKFIESYAVFTGDSPTGPTGYAVRDHFEFKSHKRWQTAPLVTRAVNDFIPRPLPQWRPRKAARSGGKAG
jgi:hypothetical protein